MWHFRQPGVRARAGSGWAMALVLAGGLAGGCGQVSPNENHSNHNFVPCSEGEKRCAGDEVEQCLFGQWQLEQTCQAPDEVCAGGSCVDPNPPPQKQTVVLQNGLNGYQGCIDIAVPVPEGSGFDEITPEDELMMIYHWVWTGS